MLIAKQIKELSALDIKRFIEKINFSDKCWEWNGGLRNGYGDFHYKGDSFRSHRISYELFRKEKIPLNMTIDHLCKNRKCVNSFHLEIVTAEENISRAMTGRIRIVDFCSRGHKVTKTSIYWNKKKNCRDCRICKKENQREYVKRKLTSSSL